VTRRWIVGALVVLALTVASCSDSGTASPVVTTSAPPSNDTSSAAPTEVSSASSVPDSPTSGGADVIDLDCADAIGSAETPPPDLTVIEGAVALPATPAATTALQTSRTADAPDGLRLFAKQGLVVRSGTAFKMAVVDPDEVAIGWGNPATPAQRVHVSPCPSTGAWLAFAGGYWVDKVGCITVVVSHNGSSTSAHVGVGAPCPGQTPPTPPSET